MAVIVREIEPGSEGAQRIAGDIDVIAYEISNIDAAPTKKNIVPLIPGSLGDASPNFPSAILIEKRFGGVLGRQPIDAGDQLAGTWSAIGYAIYKANNPFSGGQRAYAAYARRLADLALPIFRQQPSTNEDGTDFIYAREYKHISRPVSSKVKMKFIGGMTDDEFSELVDPQVGRLFQFNPNGHPYVLVGADGAYLPGSPLRAEYRFITSCAVPAYPQGRFDNDVFIPPLAPLEEYKEVLDDIPYIEAVGISDIYKEGDLLDLPGF